MSSIIYDLIDNNSRIDRRFTSTQRVPDMISSKMSHHQTKMHSSRQRSLEHLIQKGPFNEDLDASLRDLRYFIIMEGIPNNSDGMVITFINYKNPIIEQTLISSPIV